MGAFQRQILIVQVIKKKQTNQKKNSRIVNKKLLRNYLHIYYIEFMTSQIDYQ